MTAPDENGPRPAASSSAGQYDALFEQAAEEFSVPAPLLKAIAATETQFHMVEGKEEFEGRPPAYGLMALRGERLKRGAKLADVTVKAARTEPLANIRAAAALLRKEGRKKGVEGADALGAWAGAVAQFSGITNEEAQAGYVHHGVYDVLNEGIVAEKNGEVIATVEPVKAEADFPKPQGQPQGQPQGRLQGEAQKNGAKAQSYDYGPAIWRGPARYQGSRPSGSLGDVNMVVIHRCEGSYSGCWSYLKDPGDGRYVSAHYVVSYYGDEITQLVREYREAYHIGANYDCSRNDGVECYKNGYNMNSWTVGIEQGGYVGNSYPEGQVNATAKLTCAVSQDRGVPRDRNHIVGHAQFQDNRSDPGYTWPWSTFMNKVRSYCGDGTGNGRIIVDSNDNNNGSNADVVPPDSWDVGSYGDYYGTGYYFHFDEASSDPVTFRFYLETAERKTVYAWWTDGDNRNPQAPYIAYNANGEKLGTIYEDQRYNGGQWNGVGTWDFTAGWNEIKVSHWTGGDGAVIADAVMVE